METSILNNLGWFVLIYPLAMSLIWLAGSIWHYWTRERKIYYTFNEKPPVTILIPAFNEEATIDNIIDRMHKLNYENLEIIVINDGSTDATAKIVKNMLQDYPKLRFINSLKNYGKANALWLGTMAANGDYIIGIDADAYLDDDAILHLIAPMLGENNGYNIGAVTGNPKIRNRINILTKIQVAEYASIMGMIKRTQQMNNNCMTVSGVCVAYKKIALLDCGLWDKDIATEDIAVTWKLHESKWKIIFNPNAVCWMLAPEQIASLYRQRVRWSFGGLQVLTKHLWPTIKRLDVRNLLLLGEQLLGILWSFSYLIVFPFAIASFLNGNFEFLTTQFRILVFISLINFLVAFFIEQKYDTQLFANYHAVIWYPLVYWFFNVFVTISATFKYIFKKINKKQVTHATWKSPRRGKFAKHYVTDNETIKVSITKTDKYVFIPISIVLWIFFCFGLCDVIVTVLKAWILTPDSFVQAIISEENMTYCFFMLLFVSIGIFFLYLSNVLCWFPHLEKHIKIVDEYKLTCQLFQKNDLSKERIKKYIEIEGNNEINLL